MTKKEVWQMYYDAPQPRLIDYNLGKLAKINKPVSLDIVATHCFLSSSYVKHLANI